MWFRKFGRTFIQVPDSWQGWGVAFLYFVFVLSILGTGEGATIEPWRFGAVGVATILLIVSMALKGE